MNWYDATEEAYKNGYEAGFNAGKGENGRRGINMKKFVKVCNLICFVGWTLLCLAAATGAIEVGIEDYCITTGVLALTNMIDLVK